MSASDDSHDRSRLDGCEIELFKLVKKGATPEQWKEWLRAPLEHAAADGNMELFTRLMDAGVDGSAGWRGCHGQTLLGAACRGKNEGMVSALLEAGAGDDLNVFYGSDVTVRRTALHEAAHQGEELVLEALLFAGADPNLLDGMNRSPLHLAAYRLHHGAVGKLLQNGAIPNAKTIPGQITPLHLCLTRDGGQGVSNSDKIALCISELLAGGADKDAVNERGETPLCRAIVRQHPEAVDRLLAAGADTSLLPEDGASLVVYAAAGESLGILESLLQHGCEVNGSIGGGPTALHHAADRCETDDNIRALLDAGADVEARTDAEHAHWFWDGYAEYHLTPLHVAALEGSSVSTLHALVEGGADVNAQTANGRTALHIACRLAHSEDVEILLGAGADESLTDSEGSTALHLVGDIGLFDQEFAVESEIPNRDIRQMLARAPGDRAWCRRRWLVLCRSCPNRVHLARCGGNPRSAVELRAGGKSSDEATSDYANEDLARLVSTLVGLKEEGLFRLAVSFL